MLNQIKKKRAQDGFTLIELLIVIVILAILAAIVIFAVGTTTQSAKVASCNADAKSVETAVEAYKAQQGKEPHAIGDLSPNWLRQVPTATLNTNNYAITLVADTGEVDVEAKKADGTLVGPDNYDVTNDCGSAGL